MISALSGALSDAMETSVSVLDLDAVSGGSINSAAVARTSAGDFFVKWNESPVIDMFDREAEGLDALRTSGTSLRIPQPVVWRQATDDHPAFLLMNYMEPGPPVANYDERLGQGLAELHRATTDQFGFMNDNYCGLTTQPNPWTDDWLTFYREHRLRHQLHLAGKDRGIPATQFRMFERVLNHLDVLLAIDDEPPALIHGDLWAGNKHTTHEGLPALVDPAAYYGHREAELGMMNLFGGFGPKVWDAYDEAYPLQPGWRERMPLYELYHVLNHYNLFGGSYLEQAAAIARRYA